MAEAFALAFAAAEGGAGDGEADVGVVVAAGAFAVGVDHRDDFLRGDCRAVGLANLDQHAGIGRGKLEHHLVGFDVNKIFIALDRLSGLFVPADERCLGDGLGQDRDFDLDSHPLSSVPRLSQQTAASRNPRSVRPLARTLMSRHHFTRCQLGGECVLDQLLLLLEVLGQVADRG